MMRVLLRLIRETYWILWLAETGDFVWTCLKLLMGE